MSKLKLVIDEQTLLDILLFGDDVPEPDWPMKYQENFVKVKQIVWIKNFAKLHLAILCAN